MSKEYEVTLHILSPRGSIDLTFEKTSKVQEVIDGARTQFGFEPGAFLLKRQSTGEVLVPERSLVSYHLADGETVTLVPEMGSGV